MLLGGCLFYFAQQLIGARVLAIYLQYVRQFLPGALVFAAAHQCLCPSQVISKQSTLQFLFNLDQVKRKLTCRLISLLPILGQRARHNFIKSRGILFQVPTECRCRRPDDVLQRPGYRAAFKRQRRRQRLIQDNTGGENIAPPIQLRTADLLRRHVLIASHDVTGAGIARLPQPCNA